jgi:hypothetical protein
VAALRRWGPSLGLFLAVQAAAAAWIVAEIYPTEVGEALWRTLAGPLNLFTRLDRLWRYGSLLENATTVAMLGAIALLPWAHAWRARPAWLMLALSLLGSMLWAASGFLFTIDHM